MIPLSFVYLSFTFEEYARRTGQMDIFVSMGFFDILFVSILFYLLDFKALVMLSKQSGDRNILLYLRRTFPLCSLFSLQSFREAEQRRLQIY
jgi:hypothetical protein